MYKPPLFPSADPHRVRCLDWDGWPRYLDSAGSRQASVTSPAGLWLGAECPITGSAYQKLILAIHYILDHQKVSLTALNGFMPNDRNPLTPSSGLPGDREPSR